jgi:hypothetical protein
MGGRGSRRAVLPFVRLIPPSAHPPSPINHLPALHRAFRQPLPRTRMPRTPMPKTPIHKSRHPLFRKYEIRPHCSGASTTTGLAASVILSLSKPPRAVCRAVTANLCRSHFILRLSSNRYFPLPPPSRNPIRPQQFRQRNFRERTWRVLLSQPTRGLKQFPSSSVITPSACTVTGTTYSSTVMASSKSRSPSKNCWR